MEGSGDVDAADVDGGGVARSNNDGGGGGNNKWASDDDEDYEGSGDYDDEDYDDDDDVGNYDDGDDYGRAVDTSDDDYSVRFPRSVVGIGIYYFPFFQDGYDDREEDIYVEGPPSTPRTGDNVYGQNNNNNNNYNGGNNNNNNNNYNDFQNRRPNKSHATSFFAQPGTLAGTTKAKFLESGARFSNDLEHVFSSCRGRRRGGPPLRHPVRHVRRLPNAEEGRGLLRAGRAKAVAHRQLILKAPK